MEPKFVKISFDVKCEWHAFPPEYRIYVEDELFTERTFHYDAAPYYINETLQVQAVPGKYNFRLEVLEPSIDEFDISNVSVRFGDAIIIDNNTFEIL